jgi:hypothetical protein
MQDKARLGCICEGYLDSSVRCGCRCTEFKKRKMERKKHDLSRTQLRLGEEQIVVRLEL